MHSVTVQTSDDVCFVVLPEVCEHSALLKTIAEDDDGGEVPLPCISSDIMTLVLEFMRMYITSPFTLVKPMFPSQYNTVVPAEYRAFIEQFQDGRGKPNALFFATLQAANFLGVEMLVALMCAFLATLLSCKSADAIKELLS